jgi:hypothetical protein
MTSEAGNLRGFKASRCRGTGLAGPQAQRPPRGAESHMQWANVGVISR